MASTIVVCKVDLHVVPLFHEGLAESMVALRVVVVELQHLRQRQVLATTIRYPNEKKKSYLTEKRSVLRIKISPKIFFSRKIRNILPLIVEIQQPEDRAFQNISCRVLMLKNKYLALKVIVLCKYDRASIFTLTFYSSF